MQVLEKDVLSVCSVGKSERGESVNHDSTGTTSFFKTTFNTVNTLAGFLILAGDNLHKLLPNLETNIHGIQIGGPRSFIILVALIVLPVIWINKMTTLSYISATGVLAYMVILGSVLWSGLFDGVGFRQNGVLINWSGLPTACSLYTMCYHAHSVFPTLYTSSRNHGQFHLVLLISFLFSTVTYASMAIIGYLMFGSEVQSQITLSLPTNSYSSKVALFTALINPIAKYPLLLKPIVDTIETHFQSYCERKFYRLLLRTILLGISITIAVALPYFGYLMSLIGAFFSATASILLPCICYLKISQAYRKIGFELAAIAFIMPMGLVILLFGTYISMLQIINSL
ncbi:amino acid transporter AVT1I-like isoform X2 [Salvia miltiorrhiza]|uniref:amino acid transporter AVT1I-like isoform X2 n=1 Tax=Salvia miltiorrhiza TaxID=226208 RepID=UPI0025AD5828|nr:amino acid transporter AVT1I-like isoform X2 [Salvia miltiorrhiza]